MKKSLFSILIVFILFLIPEISLAAPKVEKPSAAMENFYTNFISEKFKEPELKKIRNLINEKIGRVDFSPSDYSLDELSAIQEKIIAYVPRQQKEAVWYNKNGIYVSYKGIYSYPKKSFFIIGIYVDNSTNQDIIIGIENARANERLMVRVDNNYHSVLANSIYFSPSDDSYTVNDYYVSEYGFKSIYQMNFDLLIYNSEYEKIDSSHISFLMNRSIQ